MVAKAKRSSILLLNGASSSGKTALGREIQRRIGQPFLYLSSDLLVDAGVLPAVDREAVEGEWAWRTIRPRFFDGFHRCIAAFADAGNSLIVDHVIEFQAWYDDLRDRLAGHDVFWVGVHCELADLDRREKARGDRYPGEARSHLEDGIHTWTAYDFEVDTTHRSPTEAADLVIAAYRR